MANSAVSDDEKARIAQKKCTLCCEFYVEPKILPCFDTFCSLCLKTVVDMWLTKNKNLQSIPCPRCRDEFPLPKEGVEGLKDNMYVDNVVKATSSRLKNVIMCQVCHEGREITTLCYECKDMYCKMCKHIHDRVSGSTHNEKLVEIKKRVSLYLTPTGDSEDVYTYSELQAQTDDYGPNPPPYANSWMEPRQKEAKPPLPPRVRTKDDPQASTHIVPTTPAAARKTIKPPAKPLRQSNSSATFRERNSPLANVSNDNKENTDIGNYEMNPQAPVQKDYDGILVLCNNRKGEFSNKIYASINDLSQHAPNSYFLHAVIENYGRLNSPIKKLECSRRVGISLCVARDKQIIMVNKERKKILLTVFSKTGKKRAERALNSQLITLACAGDSFLLVAEKLKDDLSWTTVERLQDNKVNYVSVRKPVLSKSMPGNNCYVIGKHIGVDVWEVHHVDFPRKSQLLFSLTVRGDIVSFDVSANGECFAVLNDQQTLFVYKKGNVDPDVEFHCRGKDICFFMKSGREVLLIADSMNDCIVMVDFADGYNVLGLTCVTRPVSFAKDEKGWLWVASVCDDNKTEVLLFPS